MTTLILPPSDTPFGTARDILANGGIIAVPTETVYGLAVNADNPTAKSALYALKGRGFDKPFTIHLASTDKIPDLAIVNDTAQVIITKFLPGALTLILPDKQGGTVGIRVPYSPIFAALAAHCPFPLAVTSANLSGQPDTKSATDVYNIFNTRIPVIIDGGALHGTPSTIVRIDGDNISVLRQGIVTEAELRAAIHG
ncbi:MAG: threonylcarbamoyl-AMP synthase [Oscillospiraceae bacterium]|jgi:L-threonylcarbamoyladenylate synthase|nr:threonylcarbamoyl-AMP synthase [Oscillospiraceae bacterium]